MPPHTSAGAERRTLPNRVRTALGVRWEKTVNRPPAGKQLQHIPHDLGQVAIRAKQEVVQITEDQLVGKGLVHGFFLLSVARKWVK